MDHEDEVMYALASDGRNYFLPRAYERDRTEPPLQYDFETEFPKTRKAKNHFFYLIIFTFLSVLGVSTLLVNRYISGRSSALDVRFSDLGNLDLNAVRKSMDKSNRYLNQYNQAQQELALLRQRLAGSKGKMDKAARKRLEAAIAAEQDKITRANERLNQERERFQQQLAQERQKQRTLIDARIKSSEAKLAEARRKAETEMKKAEREIDNLNQLHQLKLKKVRDEMLGRLKDQEKTAAGKLKTAEQIYAEKMKAQEKTLLEQAQKEVSSFILKYNPFFKKPDLKTMLSEKIDPQNLSPPSLSSFSPVLNEERVYDRQGFNELRTKINRQKRITGRLLEIPYTHSVKPALLHLKYLNYAIIQEYENMARRSERALEARRKIKPKEIKVIDSKAVQKMEYLVAAQKANVKNYKFAMNHLLKENRSGGYVIRLLNSEDVVVHMNPIYRIQPGMTGLVFRKGNTLIGKVEFYRRPGGETGAKVTEIKRGQSIKPFDEIIVNVK